jgi:hypothetical protein
MPDRPISKPGGITRSQFRITVGHLHPALWAVEGMMGSGKSGKDDRNRLFPTRVDETLLTRDLPRCLWNPERSPSRLHELVLHIDDEQSTSLSKHFKPGIALVGPSGKGVNTSCSVNVF